MNIWMITTGSSDVQLSTKKNWNPLYSKIRNTECNNCDFTLSDPNENGLFQVPARVMGIVYGKYLIDEHYDDLCFPLFDTFSAKLEALGTLPDKIIIICTDQSQIFENKDKTAKKCQCPYWQDTCTLEPIITKYFKAKFPQVEKPEYKYLKPTTKKEGLDNWDSTLTLTKNSLSDLEVEENSTIYVSHQAGTPAISSAIQFVSLAKFNNQVQFLVSNEYEKNIAYLIPSPKYLWAMKLQEATALLERYDYDGVKDILEPYLQKSNAPEAKKILRLLKIGKQWNYANFSNFARDFPKIMGDSGKNRSNEWWWTGYEAAYLAVVRLEQGNTVEALFHSFRALEGLTYEWVRWHYGQSQNIKFQSDKKDNYYLLYTNESSELPEYYITKLKEEGRNQGKIYLYGNYLFELFQKTKTGCKSNKDINTAFDLTRDKRNSIFHKLLGMTEEDVFKAWGISNHKEWEARVLSCLNFVSDQKFASLKDASLMSQVHEELREALKVYQP